VSRPAPRTLATALSSLGRELAPTSTLARVQEVWPLAVGPAIAAAASPTAERSGVLSISCTAAVWAQELKLMETDVIGRLNESLAGPRITSLRCRTA
jgi:predicted nucleic acid-binding Zn ribbon protein